jgi:hypothetical protein
VRYLDKYTVKKYIADFPNEFYSLSKTHQSDWIRLKLLNLYGGCWIDAGIIINDGLAIERIRLKSSSTKSQFTVFKSCSSHFDTPCGLSMPLAIDNFFIMAPKGSHIIRLWLTEYEIAMLEGFLHYKNRALRDGINLTNILFKDEEDVYLTQHICIQRVLQEMKDFPRMIIMNSGYFMYKIQLECNWDHELIHKAILHGQGTKKIPYIKLINSNRENLDLIEYFNSVEKSNERLVRVLRHLRFVTTNSFQVSRYQFSNETRIE